MKKLLVILFLSLVIGFCYVGVTQMDNTTETKIETDLNPATELLQ